MHKTNSFIKILAILLTLTVTLTAIPNAVYAAVNLASQDTGRQQDTVDISTPVAPDNPDIPLDTEITRANAEIFCELTENRTEFTKDYLLTNGQQVSVIYPEAVHYHENGKWEEIDNTLLAKRDGSGTISTASGPFTVTFPEKIGQGAITVTQGKYSISFSLDTQTRKVVESSTLGKESTSEVVESISKVSATIRQNTRVEQEGIKEQTFPSKIYSGLTYTNVFSSVDLRYDVRPYMLKETIVIKSFDTTQSGYSFTLDAGELIPVLLEDGSITLQDKQTQEKVFEIQSPYLMDANEKISRDIVVTLQKAGTGRDNIWNITYGLPLDWMKTAAYPVALDPVVSTDSDRNLAIEDIAVAETNSDLDTFGYDVMYLRAGKSTYYGRLRSFVKFTELKPLTPGDVITHAEIGLYKAVADADDMTICVSDVTSSWKSHTNGVSLTWANQPSIASTYEDYLYVKNAGYYYWDITDLVRQWYETGVNNGVAITAYNESSATDYKRFYSSDNVGDNPLPILIVYYTNVEGLEEYWDYTSFTCGVGGTGYVNLFSGNLTWVHDDLSYGVNHPVAISHVYNSNSILPDDEYDPDEDPYGIGNGWKTNYNQRVYKLPGNNLNTTYYVWEDGDGTKHYFKYDANGQYVDDANTGLTIQIFIENNDVVSSAEIEDKQGNKLLFGTGGRLISIVKNDRNISTISIEYMTDSGSNMYRIETIEDETDRVYTYEYDSSTGLLNRITVTAPGATTHYDYVSFVHSSGKISRIQYGDSTPTTYFNYKYKTALMSFVNETDKDYAFSITYSTGNTPKVTKVLEEINYGVRTSSGAQMTFTYAQNQTTMQDRSGHIQVLQFNDYGNTICVQDDKGNASFGEYTFNDYDEQTSVSGAERKNQLTLSSQLQSTSGNKFKDPTLKNWSSYWSLLSGYTTASLATVTTAHTGSNSLRIVRSSTATNPSVVYNSGEAFYIDSGESITFSAYVRTSYDLDGYFYLALGNGFEDDYLAYSECVLGTSNIWKRLEVTYTNYESDEIRIYPYIVLEDDGTVYVDSVQIESGKVANRFNIVMNSDITSALTTDPKLGWVPSSTNSVSKVNISSAITNGTSAAEILDNNVIKIVGNPNGSGYAYQEIAMTGTGGDSFVVLGWAKGDSARLNNMQYGAGETAFGIKVQFLKGTVVVGEKDFSFSSDIGLENSWQYLAGQIVADEYFTSIRIYLMYAYNLNVAYFDGIQLYKEALGTKYEYNNDANIKKVIDVQGGETEYTYNAQNKNNLESVTLADDTTYGFVYDDYKNVTKQTTPTGIVYTYEYDDFSNNTKAYIGTVNNPKQIGIQAQYSDNGEFLEWISDEIGNKTYYGYDEITGRLLWVRYPNDTTATRTEYEYDTRGRLLSTFKHNGTDTITESNTYSEGQLIELAHTGNTESEETSYTFQYNTLDLVSSVQVGTRTLASYTYNNAYEQYLTMLTYGNGDRISYEYDDEGRTASVTYIPSNMSMNRNPSLTYTYDDMGRLLEVEDLDIRTTTQYTYDNTNRLIQYAVYDEDENLIFSSKVDYNILGNVESLSEKVKDRKFFTEYSYDLNNNLIGLTTSWGSSLDGYFDDETGSQLYTYDGLGRVAQILTKETNAAVVTTTLGYKAPNNTHASNMLVSTTTILSQWANTYGETTSRYYYEYDGNGNITEISPDSAFNDGDGIEYEYDSINQLTRVNDSITGETWTYTYDLGGNILSKSKYAYTRGSLGTALSTVAYGYGDSSWADLLTSYKGKTITYDAIGNTLDDGTWDYVWEHGRQLKSMEGASVKWTYTYDANGQRLTKTNGTLTYHYIYDGIQLKYLKVTQKSGQSTNTVCEMYFQYGQLGLMAIQYISSSLTGTYYAVTNAQGDVVALVDGNGTVVVNYTYDAWGKLQAMTGSKASTVGKYNPIRYRGYVYDTETQLYYLNTRYYNPDMGRFINADGYVSTGQGLTGANMFAYCGNNPVNLMDPTGEITVTIGTLLLIAFGVGSLIGAISSVVGQYISNDYSFEEFSWWQFALDTVLGGASGMLSMSPLGPIKMVLLNAGIGFVGGLGGHLINGSDFSDRETWVDILLSTGLGAVVGCIGGEGALNPTSLNMSAPTAGFVRAAGLYDDVLTKATTGGYRTLGIAANAIRLSGYNLANQWNKMIVYQAGNALKKSLFYSGTALIIGTAGKGLLYKWLIGD